MYKHLFKTSTVGMTREEWLTHRRTSIGGSDAATIVGLNKYASPYSLWAEKRGLIPEKEDTEAMRQGRDLEDYVARRFAEATGKKVRRENSIIRNPDYPYAHANVDRLIVGENAGLECKTTSVMNLSKFKNGEYPAHYYVQCMHYMMITGADRWYLAILVLGREFMVFCIERDEDEIAALASAEADFWTLVESGAAPSVDGHEATGSAIDEIFGGSDAPTVDLMAMEKDLDLYFAKKAEVEIVKTELDEVSNRIKTYMGDATSGVSERYRVLWAPQSRMSFDSKKFAKEHPEIDLSGYYKQSTSRPFKPSIIGG